MFISIKRDSANLRHVCKLTAVLGASKPGRYLGFPKSFSGAARTILFHRLVLLFVASKNKQNGADVAANSKISVLRSD